jgi:hypothetical protein
MTKKERAFVIEAAALVGAGVLGAMVVPSLLSVRDSLTVVCGAFLVIGWFGWLGYFTYRLRRSF